MGISVGAALCVGGQDQPAARARGRIAGVVADSIHHRALAKAMIVALGSGRSAVSNGHGEFVIDSLDAGDYVLEVHHPMLDTIGIQMMTPKMSVARERTTLVYLAVPSAKSLSRHLCPATADSGPGVIFGRVLDAESDRPAVGATVMLGWRELKWSGTINVTPHSRSVDVDSGGYYHICGLPPALTATLRVVRGSAQAGPLRVSFDSGGAALQTLRVGAGEMVAGDDSAGGARSFRPPGHASIVGWTASESGYAIGGIQVAVEGTGATVVSGQDGRFVITGLPSGTHVLVARRVGYSPVERLVELTEKRPLEVTLRIGVGVPILQSVDISAHAPTRYLEDVGFFTRKREHQGRYFDAADFDKHPLMRFTEIFVTAGVPEISVQKDSKGNAVLTDSRGGRNSCVNVFVDDHLQRGLLPGDLDLMLQPQDVAGMEIYSRSNTPSRFVPLQTREEEGGGAFTVEGSSRGLSNKSDCVTIVIWTKFTMHQR